MNDPYSLHPQQKQQQITAHIFQGHMRSFLQLMTQTYHLSAAESKSTDV